MNSRRISVTNVKFLQYKLDSLYHHSHIKNVNLVYPWQTTTPGTSIKRFNTNTIKTNCIHCVKHKCSKKLFLRIFCILLCVIGFIYQTSQLFSVYYSGKTRTEI